MSSISSQKGKDLNPQVWLLDSSTNPWTNQQIGDNVSIPGQVFGTAARDTRTSVSADETNMPPSPSAKKKMKLMRKGLQLPQRKTMDEVRIRLSQLEGML